MRSLRFAVGCLVLFVPACANGSAGTTSTPTEPAPSPSVRTVIRTTHRLHMGQGARLDAQRGVSLRITADGPSVSRTSLSSNHGYPPSHGFYVTFRLTVANVGRRPIQIGPGDFAVVIEGQGRVSSYDGNAPYSGASSQLDPTQLAPGERVHAPLTFDVRKPHGVLGYYPDRSAAISWTF